MGIFSSRTGIRNYDVTFNPEIISCIKVRYSIRRNLYTNTSWYKINNSSRNIRRQTAPDVRKWTIFQKFYSRLATDTKISSVSVGVEISTSKKVGVDVGRALCQFFRHRNRHQNIFFGSERKKCK